MQTVLLTLLNAETTIARRSWSQSQRKHYKNKKIFGVDVMQQGCQTQGEILLMVLGVVMIVEGIPWFLSPSGYKRVLLQLLPLRDAVLRLLGLSCMLGGLLLVYWVKG